MPGIMDRNQHGYVLYSFADSFVISSETNNLALFSFFGVFWKCARVGERLSPYVSICCVLMAVS